MRSPVILMVALVLLAGGLWLVLGTGGDGSEPSALTFPSEPGEPDLVTPGGPDPVEEPDAGLRFVVELDARARILPPPPAIRFLVSQAGQEVPADVEVLAGSGASLLGGDPRPGQCLLRINAGERSYYRVVAVDRVEGRTEVELGVGAALSGQVVDRESRAVVGAEVWYGETAADGTPLTVRTDEEGRFVLDGMTGGPGTPVTVSAPGHASQIRILDPEGGELLFVLDAACRLRLQFVATADQVGHAEAAIVPLGAMTTELLQYPFLLQAVRGWRGVDEDGFCSWDDLPRGATVGVLVHHPLAPGSAPVPVDLRSASESVQVSVGLGAPMRGRVLDESGLPVAGVVVASHAAGREPVAASASRWLLPPGTLVSTATWCRTDAEGRYLVGRSRSGPGADAVRVLARDRPGLLARVESGRWRGELREDFVLASPGVEAATPELRFHAPPGASVWLRVRPEPGFRRVPVDGPLVRRLTHPALLVVRVAVEHEGRLSEPVALPARPVTGPVDVQLAGDGLSVWRPR